MNVEDTNEIGWLQEAKIKHMQKKRAMKTIF